MSRPAPGDAGIQRRDLGARRRDGRRAKWRGRAAAGSAHRTSGGERAQAPLLPAGRPCRRPARPANVGRGPGSRSRGTRLSPPWRIRHVVGERRLGFPQGLSFVAVRFGRRDTTPPGAGGSPDGKNSSALALARPSSVVVCCCDRRRLLQSNSRSGRMSWVSAAIPCLAHSLVEGLKRRTLIGTGNAEPPLPPPLQRKVQNGQRKASISL